MARHRVCSELYSQRFNRRVTRAQPEQASRGDLPLYSSPSSLCCGSLNIPHKGPTGCRRCSVRAARGFPSHLPACLSILRQRSRTRQTHKALLKCANRIYEAVLIYLTDCMMGLCVTR
ncbi:hypothetical protein MRX96_023167 [Rhipicephalus microplus]